MPAVKPRSHVESGVVRSLMTVLFALGLLSMTYALQALPAAAATFTVTNLSNSGAGSLRQAIADVNASGDTDNVIQFDVAGMLPGTITLTSGELLITNNVDIQGPGAGLLTVSGNNSSRVFNIDGSTVEISGLTVTGGSAQFGGGIFNDGGTLTLNGTTIRDNDATERGGGLHNNGGTLNVNASLIDGNTAGEAGGGIQTEGGTTNVTDSTISGNSAVDVGGGMAGPGTITLLRSTVGPDNSAAFGGGMQSSVSLTLTNSTVSGNSADDAGGIYNFFGTTNLVNSTVTDNTAAVGEAGGIFDDSLFTVNLTNSIVVLNSPSDCDGILGTFVSSGFDLDSDGSCGDANTGNANLGPLQDNGGPTETHALQTGSAAINAGDNAVCGQASPNGSAPFDQRGDGFDRIEDGTCDIGAFEVQLAPPPPEEPEDEAEFVPDPATTTPTPTRTPTPVATAQPAATQPVGAVGAISPPATGDGGLR